MKNMLRFFLSGLLLSTSFFLLHAQDTYANTNAIQVYFEGERLQFEDAEPILIDNRTLVPFRKIFETLGFEVEWIGGNVQKVIGKKDGLTIELAIDSNKASVNGSTIELDVPAQLHQSRTIVPLRFVSENSGYDVHFTNDQGISTIGIGSNAPQSQQPSEPSVPSQPAPSSESAEPYVVKGRVLNQAGQPLAGANVLAYNAMLYNSNVIGYTDEQGYYRIELPEVLNYSYNMYASYEIDINRQSLVFDMTAQPDEHFSGSSGAIRDFELDIQIGEVFAIAWNHEFTYPLDENAPWLEMKDVELTLKPVGTLVDGSTGSTITSFLPIYSDKGLEQVPVGTYEISAVWKPQGYKQVPLLVSLRDREQFSDSIVADFETPVWSSGGYFQIQLDVKFPD